MSIIEDMLEQQAFLSSETIRKAYAGQLNLQEREELEKGLLEKYNLDLQKLRPETDPMFTDYEGGRTSYINKMLGLGAEIISPFDPETGEIKEPKIESVPPFATPFGGFPAPITDIHRQEGELRKLIEESALNNRDYLEGIGIDTGGIPRNIDDTGARSGDDPQLLLSRLPPDADQTYAARKAITQRIQQELPNFTEEQLELYRDEVTDLLIFNNPLNNNKPTTVPTLNEGKGQNVLDWFRKEGPELLTLLTTGIAGTIGGLKMQDVVPGGKLAKLGQNLIGPLTGGALADSAGQFIWDFANMVKLRDVGLLKEEDWTNLAIAEEAGKNAAMTGAFSLGSAAFFNLIIKSMGVKGVWAGDFDEKQLHAAVKKGLASESKQYDPGGKGFWDKGSALRFIKRVMDADELPNTMKDAFPTIAWTDKYFTMTSEEAMSIARNIVAHKSGDSTILLGKTLPQMIKLAQDKGLLTAEESVAVGSIQDLQTMLHALRDKGNAQARGMIDDVLRPQELFLMEQYSDNLYNATGININKLREGAGEKFYQAFGEMVDKEMKSTFGAKLQVFSNNIDNLTTQVDETISRLGRGEIDETLAGAQMKDDVIAPLFKQATDEKDALYAELFKEAGGKLKNKDVTRIIDEIKAWEKTRGRQWGPAKTKLSSHIEDFINSTKATPKTVRTGAFKLQSFDDVQNSLVNARALRDEATKSADREAMGDMVKILERFRATLFKDIGGDTAAKAQAAEDVFGTLQDRFRKGIIKKVMASSDDASAIKNLLYGGSTKDSATVRAAIFDDASPEAEKAIRLVQGSIKGRLINLGRELPEEAGVPGKFNLNLMKEADFARFFRENQKLITEFFDADEAKLFFSLPKLKNKLAKEVRENQKFINRLKGNKKLKALGLDFDDIDGVKLISEPEWFANRIWTEQGGIGSITRVQEFMKALPKNKVGNNLLKDFKVMVGADLDRAITIPDSVVGGLVKTNFKGGMIDPVRLDTYLRTYSDSLDALYGPQFRKGLTEYQKMLSYFMPEGGSGRTGIAAGNDLLEKFTGQSADVVQTANGLTRAYIGIFTRPGRFLTAGLKGVERAQEKKVLDLMLHPDKFMNTYQIRKFLESPLTNWVIRNYGRPIFEKDTSLTEDVVTSTKDVATEVRFNTGGRVSPSLMPLRYGL